MFVYWSGPTIHFGFIHWAEPGCLLQHCCHPGWYISVCLDKFHSVTLCLFNDLNIKCELFLYGLTWVSGYRRLKTICYGISKTEVLFLSSKNKCKVLSKNFTVSYEKNEVESENQSWRSSYARSHIMQCNNVSVELYCTVLLYIQQFHNNFKLYCVCNKYDISNDWRTHETFPVLKSFYK